MQLSAQTIADLLGGTIEGNPNIIVSSPARIEHGKEGTLCFLANSKYEKYLYTTRSSIILINKDFQLKEPIEGTLIRIDNAYEGIAVVLGVFEAAKTAKRTGREWPSRVSWFAKIGKQCYIGAFAYIARGVKISNNVKIYPNVYVGENVKIGENTVIYAGVKIYPGTEIGANCIVHSGCVIGSDGFGFVPEADGSYKKIPQTGNVIIENNVEIGANTTIDRATMGSTIIHSGVKLDNQIEIAHNVEIGKNTVMAAQTGIAGSTKIGEDCIFGGQAGIAGHLHIGNKVTIGARTGISNNVRDGKTMFGSPAMEASKYSRSNAVFRNLPELSRDVEYLKKRIDITKEEKRI